MAPSKTSHRHSGVAAIACTAVFCMVPFVTAAKTVATTTVQTGSAPITAPEPITSDQIAPAANHPDNAPKTGGAIRVTKSLSPAKPVSVKPEAAKATMLTKVGRGPVTNLPLPRYVSMKGSKANVRRGPSKSHRIDWVYTRRDIPLEIVAEFEHWRRVRDQEGVAGWIHYSLLSGVRTVLIEQDMLGLHLQPDEQSALTAKLEIGVVARLGDCSVDWCHLSVAGYRGWAPKSALWGVSPDEIRD